MKKTAPNGKADGAAGGLCTRLDIANIVDLPRRFHHATLSEDCKLTAPTRAVRDHLESAAEARRRGDHGAADAAELAALILLRAIGDNLPIGALLGVPPARRWP
jgi:hypothetical protein